MYTGCGGGAWCTTTGRMTRIGCATTTCGCGKRPKSMRPYTPGGLTCTDTPTSAAAALPAAASNETAAEQDKIAQYLYNSPEYLETQAAAFKIRGCPVNVNYRYLEDELAYLLDNADCEAIVFHAGTAVKDGKYVTAGGRVLTVTAIGGTFSEATDRCYAAARAIEYDGRHFRSDIARDALEAVTRKD